MKIEYLAQATTSNSFNFPGTYRLGEGSPSNIDLPQLVNLAKSGHHLTKVQKYWRRSFLPFRLTILKCLSVGKIGFPVCKIHIFNWQRWVFSPHPLSTNKVAWEVPISSDPGITLRFWMMQVCAQKTMLRDAKHVYEQVAHVEGQNSHCGNGLHFHSPDQPSCD